MINVARAGYLKVLGKGVLQKKPLIVKAKFFSRQAEEKIKNAIQNVTIHGWGIIDLRDCGLTEIPKELKLKVK